MVNTELVTVLTCTPIKLANRSPVLVTLISVLLASAPVPWVIVRSAKRKPLNSMRSCLNANKLMMSGDLRLLTIAFAKLVNLPLPSPGSRFSTLKVATVSYPH